MNTNATAERVAQSVRAAMTARGVSQVALADATGIPRVTLIRRLNGHTAFTVTELGAIAEVLGKVAADFLAEAS